MSVVDDVRVALQDSLTELRELKARVEALEQRMGGLKKEPSVDSSISNPRSTFYPPSLKLYPTGSNRSMPKSITASTAWNTSSV
jgi:cell division septum initiation protein DivIVA